MTSAGDWRDVVCLGEFLRDVFVGPNAFVFNDRAFAGEDVNGDRSRSPGHVDFKPMDLCGVLKGREALKFCSL